ncbi:MAG: glycoside hydrolase family 3 C-terminal domain-containing protein [Saprospiraceae bacterium]|nr:glycoside hydrolase family 3 C-terminal domain-containing protein [Saprospiraceae bacterium]
MNPYILLLSIILFLSCNQEKPSNEHEQQIESLIRQMSLEEKIGQMTQLNITTIVQDSILEDYGNVSHYVLDTAKLVALLQEFHVGSFLNGRAVSPENWVYVTETIQNVNKQHSAIPILYGIDHVHGASYLRNGTIFPHNINIGCSFDTSHAFLAARTAALETADLGHHWIFAPVLGLGRAKSWGRFYETYSEDPLVVSRMGVAAVHGIQDFSATTPYRTAACAKHFLGYSDPKSGWDRSPAEISDQALREFFLPPFKAALDAGALTIMINSGEINGIPVHASHELLTDLLREELGFQGIAVTDWLDIIALDEMHGIAENEKEATYMAIMAGVDMSMVPVTTNFCVYLKELVEEGRIPESRINESVRRILWVKFKLGLFDQVLPRADRLDRINSPEHIAGSLQAARESMVLIKNEGQVLPIRDKKILVGGFTLQSKVALCGGWTYRFAADSDRWFPEDMQTIYDALLATFGESQIQLLDENRLSEQARWADVIVLATGENTAYAETQGTIDDLALDAGQANLIGRCLDTQKPVVLILTEGRPRLIPEVEGAVDGILFAGLPGVYGAQAIAEILSGAVNPSGKMAFTYPKRSGHIISYNHKKAEYSSIRPVSEELQRYSIAPFGHGLSYSTFVYSGLRMDTTFSDPSLPVSISVEVRNESAQDGKEAVLWFVSDLVGSITRPVRELVHFEKQLISAGESRTFSFELIPERDLAFPDKLGQQLLEPGQFRLEVGGLTSNLYYRE